MARLPLRTGALLLVALAIVSTPAAAQDPGLPLPGARPSAAAPAPVTTATFVGAFALRGHVGIWPDAVGPQTVRLEVRVQGDGLAVTRRFTRLGKGSGTWTSRACRLLGDTLEVTYRLPRPAPSVGITGALDGEARPAAPPTENVFRATLRFEPDGLLHESVWNQTRLAPEDTWHDSVAAGVPADAAPAPSGPRVTTLVSHGHPSERYDLTIVSEGYPAHELAQFRADAARVVRELQATSPFAEYWPYLNVHRLEVASPGTGIPGGRGGGPCLFGTRGRGVTTFPRSDRGRIESMAKRAPGADAVLVLVNDDFRSVAHQGWTLVSACDARLPRVAVHELGHTIGFLLDEYTERPESRWDFLLASDWAEGILRWGGWGANVTTHTSGHELPWRDWVAPGTPLPTPAGRGHGVGAYQGAFTMPRGWYRPQETCLMRDSREPFCAVCREALVLRLSRHTFPLRVETEQVDANTWRISLRTVIPGQKRFTWYRSEHFEVGQGNTFYATRSDTPWGECPLVCVVEDLTPWVRRDPHDWSTFSVHFVLDKGYAWDRGLRLRGPWRGTPEAGADEEVFRLFDGH